VSRRSNSALSNRVPKELHGTPIAAIAACWTGDPAAGSDAMRSLQSFGTPRCGQTIRHLRCQAPAARPSSRSWSNNS